MSHNLDIESYTLRDLCGLFDLDTDNITHEGLKMAKKKVLMMHPDKSRLGPEYFLFYKKAFDVIIMMYDNVTKMSQTVEDQEYVPEKSAVSNKEMRKNIQNISKDTFHKQFNEIFEKHGSKTIDKSKNDWFTSTDALYDTHDTDSVLKINGSIDRIKERQQKLTVYKGVNPLMSYGGNGLYDDDGDNIEYHECDPFSKLKFDDLRKVHKDQTVIGVRESDMASVAQYRNVDEFQKARHVGDIKPMRRSHAESMIHEQERALQERMRQKKYQSELTTLRHIETNKTVMANFLKLT